MSDFSVQRLSGAGGVEAAAARLSDKLRSAPNDADYMQVVVGFHDLSKVLDHIRFLDDYAYQLEGYVDPRTVEAVQVSVEGSGATA